MYPYYYPLPPPNPYLAILRAEKVVEAVDRENVILNRQVCELARQNIDLRTRLIKMNADKRVSDSNEINIGYSKQALQTKQELKQRKFDLAQDRRYRTGNQANKMDRAYSFGRLKKENEPQKKQKHFSSLQKERKSPNQPSSAPNARNGKQKKYNYLTLEQKQQRQAGRANTNSNTFIQRLSQFNKNQQNPENVRKPFLRIESQAFNEPIPETNQEQNSHSGEPQSIKKDNRVYLEKAGQARPATYSPISKLKSIKKLNDSQEPAEVTIQSRKTMGKKHYLSLIGNVFDRSRRSEEPDNVGHTSLTEKPPTQQ